MRENLEAGKMRLPAGAHFGQLKQMRDFVGLVVAESHYAPSLVTPSHTHETAGFTVVLHGGYVEEHGGRSFDCFPGRILFRAAEERHYDSIGPVGAHCVMLEMRPLWQERFGAARLPSSACQMQDRHVVAPRLQRELAIADDVMPLAIESLVLELCCNAQRSRADHGSVPPWLKRLREKLEAEFAGKQSLQALAKDAEVHPAHLARAFHRHFGCSVGEYVRRRRVAFASERIAAGGPLSGIALDAGFANQSHLSRTFKAITGLSPGEFRRQRCKAGARDASSVKDL